MMEEETRRATFHSLVLCISRSRGVLYANTEFCAYVGLPIEQVVGREPAELAALTSGEVAEFFAEPNMSALPNRLVADGEGRVFEIKTASRQGITDLVLDEVSGTAAFEAVLAPVVGIPFAELGEDELRTVRVPDLRFITSCTARMKPSSALAGKIPPLEHRVLTGIFMEETAEAFLAHGCTVLPARGVTASGFAGAPRYHADHALRALEAAFEIVWRIGRVRENSSVDGRDIPPVACGVASGNAVAGGFGSGRSAVYLADGDCVDAAERLSRIAAPGEVLVGQAALEHILSNLPPEWTSLESEAAGEPDLDPYAAHAGSILPLENSARCIVAGPAGEGGECSEIYRFEELWRLENGTMAAETIFRAVCSVDSAAVRPEGGEVLESGFVTRLGKYRLAEVVGSGGMGRVWKAQDAYGNTVAVKTLHTSSADSPDAIRRFRREAEIMSRIPHRNICRIFETGEQDGTHFLAMEFVEGLTLSEILNADAASTVGRSGKSSDLPSLIAAVRRNRSSIVKQNEEAAETDSESAPPAPTAGLALPPEQAVGLMEKICEAVEFAHEHGVLHRDLKPGNILLRADGEPLVADFGLAKLAGETGGDGGSLSMSGNVVGTVENMAPEQAESSKGVDARADVYSLGTILYQMCTGRRHFTPSGNFLADFQALQTHEPVRPRQLNPAIDPDLEVIILKCLRAVPDDRYRSVSALLADLQRFRRGEPIAARPVTALDLTRKLVRRNKAASIVAAVSLVLILALVAGAMWSLSDRLAKEEAARSESERLRLVAEEKEQEAIRNAEEAAELAELAKQRLEEITAAELRATEKEKETAAERKKREEVEAAAAAEKKEFEDNLERLNQEIARSAATVGRALRARLVETISIPILIDGRVSGKTTLPAGETLEVLREDEQRVFVKTRFGDQWIAKSKTEIEREAVQAPAPAPVAAPAKPKEPLTADLSQGKESTKVRHARAGILYQATGFNGATVCFLVTELDDQKLAYQWRAPSDETPEGIAGTGVVDLKNGGTVLEAGPVKLSVNASKNPVLLGYDSTKGVLNRVEAGALAQTPWAEPLVGLVKSVEAKPPVAAAEPDRWPIVLLDELFHIGDDTMPGFSSPKPQGSEFQTTFSVQQPPLAGVNLTVWVSDIVPNSNPLFKEGSYRTQVRINGTEAGILNEQIGGVLDSTDIEKVVIPIKGSLLRQGPNEFTITGGSAPDGNTDDFNLRKVTLELEKDGE